jgi:hypothetical protein
MVNRWLLAVSLERLKFWLGCIWVELDIQVEDMVAESLGRPKRGNEESCSEWLRGCKELNWEIFVGLVVVSMDLRIMKRHTHKVNLGLP